MVNQRRAVALAESCLAVAESLEAGEVPIHLLPCAGAPLHNGLLDVFGYIFADLDGIAGLTEHSREEESIAAVLGVDSLHLCPGVYESVFALRALGDWPVFSRRSPGGGGTWFESSRHKSGVLAVCCRCLANELMVAADGGEVVLYAP